MECISRSPLTGNGDKSTMTANLLTRREFSWRSDENLTQSYFVIKLNFFAELIQAVTRCYSEWQVTTSSQRLRFSWLKLLLTTWDRQSKCLIWAAVRKVFSPLNKANWWSFIWSFCEIAKTGKPVENITTLETGKNLHLKGIQSRSKGVGEARNTIIIAFLEKVLQRKWWSLNIGRMERRIIYDA